MVAPGVEQLMERAGTVLAEAVYRFAGPMPVFIALRPREQRRRRLRRRIAACFIAASPFGIAAIGEPSMRSGARARLQLGWRRRNAVACDGTRRPSLIDCLFGTGLRYGIEGTLFVRSFSD